MDKEEHEKNKKKLIDIYNSIPDSKKHQFMKALGFLGECFLDE